MRQLAVSRPTRRSGVADSERIVADSYIDGEVIALDAEGRWIPNDSAAPVIARPTDESCLAENRHPDKLLIYSFGLSFGRVIDGV